MSCWRAAQSRAFRGVGAVCQGSPACGRRPRGRALGGGPPECHSAARSPRFPSALCSPVLPAAGWLCPFVFLREKGVLSVQGELPIVSTFLT